MSERTLTQPELNRALLQRQLLLDRARLTVPRALERLGGIQNQYAPNAYIRLASCLESFRREDLDRALERRTAVQGTLMRATIHTVSARDYWLFAAGLRRTLREAHLRIDKSATDRELRRRDAKLRRALADGPKTAKELGGLITGSIALWGELVRVPPSGTWEKRRADRFALAEDWLGPCDATEEQGLEHLLRRYLGGFGPATLKDVAFWAGGRRMPTARFEPAVESLRLRRFRDEQGRELFDLPRAPLPGAEADAPPRFLPTWDAILLVHARRTGVMPEQYRPIVFSTKIPPSVPTFLVDGAVRGAWKYEAGRIVLTPYEPLSRIARRELDAEARRILDLYTTS